MYINISEIMRLKGRLVDTKESIESTLKGVADELSNVNNNIRSQELISSNEGINSKVSDLTTTLNSGLGILIDFLEEQINSYQSSNDEAKGALEELIGLINGTFDTNGNIIVSNLNLQSNNVDDKQVNSGGAGSISNLGQDILSGVGAVGVMTTAGSIPLASPEAGFYNNGSIPETSRSSLQDYLWPENNNIQNGNDAFTYAGEASLNYMSPNNGSINGIDTSMYSSKPESGFVVSTGNQNYSLNASDRDLIYAIVAAESDKSYDDSLAVASVILNRCETPNWVSSYGTNPVAQATAPNQFVVYQHGSYKKYAGGNAPDAVKKAVDDALSGVRNCDYLSFRSNGSTSYSSNQVTASGNRYK